MSTLPHDSPDVAAEAQAAMVAPVRCDFNAPIQHFATITDALGTPRPSTEELPKLVDKIAAFTRELFPGNLAVEISIDPEVRDDVCLLFQVNAAGTIAEILARESRWLRMVSSLAPQWPGLFCLSIDAR